MPANGSVLISEFVAVNDSGLKDEDGDTADWIEIYNNDLVPVNLEGWSLTDEAQNLGKWKFPVTVLSPGQYLIVFASGKDRDVGELHTNFKISITGGFLALVRPDGTTIEHAFPSYPLQYPDIAYGLPGQKREDALIGAASEMLYQDPALGAPEVGWMEAGYEASSWMKGTNGIGYTSGLLDYDPLIRTSLPGPEEGIFTRFNFTSKVENRLDSLKINYDDGFAAFLNGVMIETRNAPLVLEQDSRAVASHEGSLAMQTETINISQAQHLLRTPLPQGVVASWDPVGMTNEILTDALGRHDGTLQGPTLVTDWQRGPVLDFNGNDLVVIPTDTAFDLLDFTISTWIYVVEGQTVSDRLISRDNVTGTKRMSFALRTAWANGGRPTFQVGQNPPSFLSVAESKISLSTGWHHLAGVRNAGDSVRIYVDGVLQGQGQDYIEAGISNDAPVTIGGYLYGPQQGQYFRGRVDEVQIFNRALSGEEIGRVHALGGISHSQNNSNNVLAVQLLNHEPEDQGRLMKLELLSSVPSLNSTNEAGYLMAQPYTGNGVVYPGVADAPLVSHPEGIYGSNFVVSLADTNVGSVVLYTLDGTIPNEFSSIFDNTVTIEPPAVLRLRRYTPGLLPSLVMDFHYLDAPIFINEFLAINTTVNPDNVDLEDFSDWIELRNTSSRSVDLSGYRLTDDPEDTLKWRFPAGTIIRGNSMLLVWADGHDAAPGDLVQRDFSPYKIERLQRVHADFKLSGDGESVILYTPGGVMLDRVDFGSQLKDISQGRAVGSNDTWLFFGEPTPGVPNTTPGVMSNLRSSDVEFSIPGGVYTSTLQLTLSVADTNAVIRFTTDGTRPGSQSPIHNESLVIDQSMVVRATSYKDGQLPGLEKVQVYLFDTNSTLPIVSLATYPDLLYDPLVGIFSNTLKKREMPVHIDFYESDGEGEFHLDAGMRLIGFVILDSPQKTMSINLDDKWGGAEVLNYPIFPERDYESFQGFLLRPGGQDGDVSFLREGMINKVLEGQMDVDRQAYRPARLYLNGAYHGLYNIREKQDLEYLRSNHPGVGNAKIDYIEHDVIPAVVLDGNDNDYKDLVRFMETNSLATAENYDYVSSRMDVNEFMNFQITSIYIGRHSPDHNIKFWKTNPAGRWRWLVFDVDQMWALPARDILAYVTSPVSLERAPLWSTIELRSLLQNDSFKEEFIHRFVTHINTTFAPNRVRAIMEEVKSVIDPEMPWQIARWPSRISSLATWENNVVELGSFTDQRPAYQLAHIKNKFGLADMNELTVSYNAAHGAVLVHDVVVPATFSGNYFEEVPVKLKAVPSVGYRFVEWTGWSNGVSDTQIEVDVTGGVNLTASFELDPDLVLLPGVIDSEYIVSNGPTKWVADGDIVVAENGRLVLDPGATILMPDKGSIYIEGGMEVRGTAENPVTIGANPAGGARSPLYHVNDPSQAMGRDHRWGALVFDRAMQPVLLKHLQFTGSSQDLRYPEYSAGILAIDTDLTMENLFIEDVRQPILVLGGRVLLRDSFIHIKSTGDGINVKGAGYASVENCEFLGGLSLDTDAIDYDQIATGQIVGNQIHGFLGFNSDGIDLGEGSSGILIEGNRIYDCTDKGISVGQGSTATILRNIIYQCEQGVGVKDAGSFAFIDRCTFYNNRYGVAAFEKNPGAGGGWAQVMNSILSFSKDTAVYVDPLGLITTDFCMANTEVLTGFGNLFDGPEFFNSYAHDFRLKSTSSAIDMGNQLTDLDPDGTRADLGAIPYTPLTNEVVTAGIVITEVHYNPSPLQGTDDDFEFVELYNSGEEPVDLEGYSFVVGIQYTFPAGSVIGPRQYILVAKNSLTYEGNGYSVFQWETGKLDNGGELLVLLDDEGFAVDMVQYGTGDPWPVQPDGGGSSLMILDPELSNATSRNWVSGTDLGGTPGLANWGGVGGIRLLTNPLRIETSWTALPGIVYQLEYRDSLSSGNWVPVGESIMATAGQVIFADELPVLSNENGKQGFYRVRIILPSESE